MRHVLAGVGPRALSHFGTDLTGVRLVATDTDIAVGEGPRVIELPAADLLLRITGRSGPDAGGS